ncbi:collectrin isoform X2 [Ornithorhynchus anatinus]|uniref:collectrin isoform X2 n=1 Tax=Ornithorhynchus anatinus TaxID=9258 RepID=UPI0019D4C47B|nr:collectrin isoform X2 [Ornithorhynchus anatinus]
MAGGLLLAFSLATVAYAQLCQPDAKNAFKVRFSIKTALGDNAYAWDSNEEYLFKAMVAFSMRKYPNRGKTEMNRNRINNAFFLNDQTLEFLKIPSTLAPPTEPSVPVWMIVFGVVFCLVIIGIALLIMSGIQQHRRKSKSSPEMDDVEDKCETTVTVENGIPCETLDPRGGQINGVFVADDERFTPL